MKNFILFDKNQAMIEAWEQFFTPVSSVSIQKNDISNLQCDAIVSPANSFGFMDGGLDRAISERLGWDVQKRVQEKIYDLPEGELLVGKALTIETNKESIPYLIVAPTMRVPMRFNISTSINAYLAMKAVLIEFRKHTNIKQIAIPGFCTGTGEMDYTIAARQMFIAYQEIEIYKKIKFHSFKEAQDYQLAINPNGEI